MPAAAKVRFYLDADSPLPALVQVRDQVLAYIHLGLLPPGYRLPAVRELAAETGVNLKTAFRIYRGLADDGLVEIRPQQGVFVKSSERAGNRSYHAGISSFLERIAREAQQYNLSPMRVCQMLAGRSGAPVSVRCAFLECNPEQTGVFSAELRRRLGLDVVPVLTNAPRALRERALRQADVFITTYYHREEVSLWSARHHKEVFCIRLNPEFHRMLVRHGRRGMFPMVMSDISHEPRFRRVMSSLLPPEALECLVLVPHQDRKRVRELLRLAPQAYVSPLVYDEVRRLAPASVKLITLHEMISRDSIEHLRRSLLLADGSRR